MQIRHYEWFYKQIAAILIKMIYIYIYIYILTCLSK